MPDSPDRRRPDETAPSVPADSPAESQSTFEATGTYRSTASSTKDSAATTVTGDSADSLALPQIPGYAVIREIARGGMGRVLLANDLSLNREVAIKVLLPGSTPDAAARFLTESRVTARLPHPGIPPVYAVGELAEGGPFLAMKLVRGRTLGELLRERQESLDELSRWIGVFEQACQAVGFAHSQGVLHRDLKPGNLMVGAFGEVHVMDWGLAKEVQIEPNPPAPRQQWSLPPEPPTGEDAGSASEATAAGQVMGTPRYMAPEQARGEPVDARTDVFALGGILSMILTDQPPFTGGSTSEVLGKAAAGRVDEALARLAECPADSELSALARRCLAPDPADRPADGHAVAEAIQSYREGVARRLQQAQTERAAADARAAEQRKRQRVWAIAAIAVVAVLVLGASLAGSQWLRAQRALRQVTLEQQKTLAALNELTASRDRNVRNLGHITDRLAPDLFGRKRNLTDADRAFVRSLLPMWQETAAARGDSLDALQLRAAGHFAVASIQSNLGQHAEAEQAFREALQAYDQLSREDPANPAHRRGEARTHNNLGLELAIQGRVAQALEAMRQAQAIQLRLVEEFPDALVHQRDLAKSHLNIGNQLSDQGDASQALREYQTAAAILDQVTGRLPDNPLVGAEVAAVRANLGKVFRALGRGQDSIQQYRASLALYETLDGRHPDPSEYMQDLGLLRANLGGVLLEAGLLEEAEEQLRQALAIQEELVSEFPSLPEYRSSLVQSHNNLAIVLAAARRPDEAEKLYVRALELAEQLVKQAPAVPEYQAQLASTHDNLGLVLDDPTRAAPRPAEAEKQHRAALALWTALQADLPELPEYHDGEADCRNHLAMVLYRQGRHDEADPEFRQALRIWEKMAEQFPDSPEHLVRLAGGFCNFGNLVEARGDSEAAVEWLGKAIALLQPRVAAEPNDASARRFLRNSLWSRAEIHDKLGRTDEATSDWDEAVRISTAWDQTILREKRAQSRVRAGLAEEAVQEIDAIAPLLDWPADNRYTFASVYALASDQVQDQDRQQRYADQAMAMLRQAVQGGWNDADRLTNDPDWNSLRDRDDFQKLLDDLIK